jgi:hypothetical protein
LGIDIRHNITCLTSLRGSPWHHCLGALLCPQYLIYPKKSTCQH